MEQILYHRDVRYVVGHEQGALREWAIYPDDGPAAGARRGLATADGTRGSFKSAVMAAQKAIDAWLDVRDVAHQARTAAGLTVSLSDRDGPPIADTP